MNEPEERGEQFYTYQLLQELERNSSFIEKKIVDVLSVLNKMSEFSLVSMKYANYPNYDN